MNTFTEKQNKDKSLSDNKSSAKNTKESGFQFVDNRPEALAQRKLRESADKSKASPQLTAFQGEKVIQGVFQYSHKTRSITDSGRTPEEIAQYYQERGWELQSVWTYDGIEVYTDARNTGEAMGTMASGYAQTAVMIDVSMNMDGSSQLLVSPEYYNELFEMGYFEQRGLQRFQMYQQFLQDQESEVDKEENIRSISSTDYEVIKILDSGSTRPQHVKFKGTNIEKVIKFGKDQGHLLTEILSNKLYEKAGIPTLKTELVKIDGKLAQMTDFVKGFKEPEEEDLVSSEDFLRHIGADMLFANWDLFKTDNWMQIGDRMVRGDNGGALDRSAQGHMKEKEDWNGKEVRDINSMRDKKNSPYRNATNHEVADSIRTLSKTLTPDKIDEAFEESHYPLILREQMKTTLLERLKVALKWSDEIYTVDTVVNVDHSWDDGRELELAPEDDGPIDHAAELIRMGFTGVPVNATPEIIGDMLRNGMIQPPKPGGKTGNPHESIPMVGPEELTREDQFGGGLAEKMPKFFSKMVSGRLVRRMSDGERNSFIKAAASKDIMEIVNLIFPPAGKPGARGEMVLSVNKPFIFEREKAKMKGEEYKGDEEAHDPKDYHWVMEMFITDEMLKFLQDYAYINNPTGKEKPSAFMGNPTLKLEGQAGGRGGEGGIPNVVIKKDGFAKFWRGVESFQFVEAEDHLWKHSSDNSELLEAREKRKIADKIQKAKDERKLKELIEKSRVDKDDGTLYDLFGDNPTPPLVQDEETAYDLILKEFRRNNLDQVQGILEGGHGGLVHPGNQDAPLSQSTSHKELRSKNLSETSKARVTQNAQLNEWFLQNHIAVAPNAGSGLNCLIISLIMHASGKYEDKHNELAAHYRESLVRRFVDINPNEMLYSDNPAYVWLVGEINRDFGSSLDVQFVQSDELGKPYLVPAIRTGNTKVVIVDYGGHYEAIYKTE